MRHSSLPTAPPRCIYQVLLAVFDAGEDAVFSQDTLKRANIDQYKAGLSLLRWLGLVSSSGRLAEDILEARGDRQRLGVCLRERLLTAACSRCGCERAVIEELLSGKAADREIEEQIRSLPVIKGEKWPSVLSNKANALKTLVAIVTHGADRQWMQRELAALELRARRRRRPQPEGRPPPQSRFVIGRNDRDYAGVENNGNGCTDQLIRQVTEGALVNESVLLVPGARSIRAEVYYPAGLTSSELLALGQHFLDKAEQAARQPTERPESLQPRDPTPLPFSGD